MSSKRMKAESFNRGKGETAPEASHRGSSNETSNLRVFYNTLPSTLRKILEKIDQALESEQSKKDWPTKAEFDVAHKLLLKKGDSTKEYLLEIFLPAWEQARRFWTSNNVEVEIALLEKSIDFDELVQLFADGKDQDVKNAKLTMQIVQRWGISTVVNPTTPTCFLMKQEDDTTNVIVMKVFGKGTGSGAANYKMLASQPLGAKIIVHDFLIMANMKKYLPNNFVKIKKDFEINATNAILTMSRPGESFAAMKLTLAQLSHFRLKTKVEGRVEVLTSTESVKLAGEPVQQFVAWSGNKVKRWTIDVYDLEASIAKLTLWEKEEMIKEIQALDTREDITISVLMPSSIKMIDGCLIVAGSSDTVIEIIVE